MSNIRRDKHRDAIGGWVCKCFFATLLFVAFCISTRAASPVWLNQIRLSAINGYPDHPLAVINGKTVSSGEGCELKLKGQNVQLQCLEIHEQSLLVQIQGVSSPCELTYAGIVLPPEPTPPPAMAQPSPPPVMPAPVLPVQLFVPSQPVLNIPSNSGEFHKAKLIFGGIVCGLVLGFALGFGINKLQIRQNIGEAMLAEVIDANFSRPHLLLNNVTLPTAEGTTQIDHILVADTGIFVIETKHYQGWIFGNPKESQWTQMIYRHKSRFPNPLRQNYGHVKALQALFNLPEDNFRSIVVFTGNAEFKSDLGSEVLHLADLIPFLEAERPVLFDERKMAYIIGRIEMFRKRRSLETDEYHISYIRARISGRR